MLNSEEEKFVKYWEQQRLRKKAFLRNFSIGLPLGVGVAATVLINLFSGWYTRATTELHSSSSLIIVILVAVIGIVVFITIFSAHHRFDQNEKLFQELLKKREEVQQGLTN